MSTRAGICNFCGTGCGHLLQVEGGAVRGVFASPGHPVSRGRLCVRGWHIHELLATSDKAFAVTLEATERHQAPTVPAQRLTQEPQVHPRTPSLASSPA